MEETAYFKNETINYRVYTPNWITFATYLGGPLAGCYLMSKNLKNFGNEKSAKQVLRVGIISSIIFFTGILFVPKHIMDAIPNYLIPLIYTAVIGYYVKKTQNKYIREHIEKGGQKYSGWKVTGIAILCGILTLLYAFIVSIFTPTSTSPQEKLWKELTTKANMLYEQRQYVEAANIAQEALTVAEETFGLDHPNVALSLHNLAVFYQAEGKYAEAEPLYKRSVKIREKALGKNHALVGPSLCNLALIYQAQGRYSEAEPLFKRALAINEKALGPNHPDVATICENMAELCRQIGKEDEAERLEARARRIRSNQ